MKAAPLLLLGTLVLFSGRVRPEPPDLTIRQLNHRVFTATDGAPTDISALAQTSDGTLWIGSPVGLTRFDGVRFVRYPRPGEEPLQATNISSLLAAPDGTLWIGFRPGGVSALKGGHVTRYSEREGLPNGTVAQFASDRDGSVWAAARSGLVHFKGKRLKSYSEPELATPYGVLVDGAGTLWVATVDGLRARIAGESRFREVDRRSYSDPLGAPLATSPDGRLWSVSSDELVHFDGPEDVARGGVVAARGVFGGRLTFDHEGNLWGSDAKSNNLLRASSISDPEKFSSADGAGSGRVFAILEDRERNVWAGTSSGLHRFSHTNVVRDFARPCARGLFSGPAIVAGDAGALWIACDDGAESHVDEIRDGTTVSRQATPAFSVAYRDPQGTVWFSGSTALGHLESGRVVITPMPSNLQGRPPQAVMRDSSGAMWFSVSRRGIFRLHDGEWSEYGNLDGLPRDWALVETAGSDGTLWFGYANSRIARVNGNRVQMFESAQGLEVGNILAIFAHATEVWAGGELGVARFDGKRFVPVRGASGAAFIGVSGIVRARNGDLWFNGVNGIARIAQQEVERLLRDPTHPVQAEIFDYLDGVPGTAVQLRAQPSAIETTDGRMWFSMSTGIISIDATRLVRNTLAPPVTIWSLTSGPKRYPNFGSDLHLPVHTTDLQIDYSAGSLTVPERVRFRYKLEGSDRDWQEVGTRREALYTNLGPGDYTFRVTASNNDGVWNHTGAMVRFTIPPAIYQTRWFFAACGLAGVTMLISLYRVRVRQVAAQVRGRLEARLAERERIARDLHDTLLQGMQGLIWRFQAATDRMLPDEPARRLMEQSLDRADELLGESRDKVKDLRPAAKDVVDLAQALAVELEQFAQLQPVEARVNVQGSCRDLHPIVREEGLLIGREALSNAFRHARAAHIEAEVTYGETALRIRIRDDGQGISTAVQDAGAKPGHFGLIGMRERANKLGAHLEVWSKPGVGTEIELRVPAAVAYRGSRTEARGIRKWLASLRFSAQTRRDDVP